MTRPTDALPGLATRAVHDGQQPDPVTGAVVPPIYQTSTFVQDGVNEFRTGGHEYSRGSNPTRNGFEEQLASLERGTRAFAFASGMAAEDALLRAVLAPGDHVVLASDVYGGTFRLVDQVLSSWGIEHSVVPSASADDAAATVRPGVTRVLWLETPSNPLLRVADVAAWAVVARDAGALLVVDNTFATPALQNPLTLGAHAVVHSTTKYIGGHSDVLGGAVVVGDAPWRGEPLAELMAFQQFACGAVAGPFDAFLAARGLKTLPLRVERHCVNALEVARFLRSREDVAEVNYPGLEEHPQHELASRTLNGGFGGIVSFRPAGGVAAAHEFVRASRLYSLSVSLGGVESLACVPQSMTHASRVGTPYEVPEDLVRLSVGIEDLADHLADLEQALDAAAGAASGDSRGSRDTSSVARAA
ncbi:cystathionine gamma-synthase [Kocuria tytonicola]|uniref:Cystathionine gamma-synthase n=1 Tax=Kocuria tytonicola TaxID=2055946 RepID=A0A3L9KZ53_9MICC|nr:cystathionine gamma-synthase [Kocuria tytonicola]RLY91551.1 cystathionine gamma-synthase [Kocuria tytonicola]